MPRKVKIQKKLPKGAKADASSLHGMFAQMTGSADAEPKLIIPKIVKIKISLIKYSKILKLMYGIKSMRTTLESIGDGFDEIEKFTLKLDTELNLFPDGKSLDEKKITKTLNALPKTDVNAEYKKIKNNDCIKRIIVTTGNLSSYVKDIGDASNLRDSFIKKEIGLELKPFCFSELNIKQVWQDDNATGHVKNFILNILNRLFVCGKNIHQVITSPDVNIAEFSSTLINSIKSLKGQIPRCDMAFNMIADSVKLLEGNFDGYYRSSIEAENPSVIMESFISDVALKQKHNVRATMQFKKIISFIQKKASGNKDPRVAKLFKMLNNQFTILESKTDGGDDSKSASPDATDAADSKSVSPDATDAADSKSVSPDATDSTDTAVATDTAVDTAVATNSENVD
jgi:hypothetical protein